MSDTHRSAPDASASERESSAAPGCNSGDCCQTDPTAGTISQHADSGDENSRDVRPTFSLVGMLLLLASIVGMFAILQVASMPEMERWVIFTTGFLLLSGWWVISVGSSHRRQQPAMCSSASPETLSGRQQREQFSASIREFAAHVDCSPEGAHFLSDAIFFSPNYFDEDTAPDEPGETVTQEKELTSQRVLTAVVRYARECFGDQAEIRMGEWGFDSREKLQFVIEELATRGLAHLGTRGYTLAFGKEAPLQSDRH
ncbi:MAG: hypothetical protein MPJ50_03715 [Pirellulales bacterium]|nr:hypothetical protein [Pirellulales bacterium]